ncbi:MAG: Fe-S-cluster-containing hydrogenase component 2/putative sterol carrier protein [Planctomycetota bacterium]|jgi:Fe-S-cluster-containing hydrogenase component 2/putative sterol carrier protein
MLTSTPTSPPSSNISSITKAELEALALASGADDVGLVNIDNSALDVDRADIEQAFPGARTLVSFVIKMNREPIRSPARSLANNEFHHAGEDVDEVGRKLARALEERGIRALAAPMGFPMEMDRFPGKLWVISHKLVAEAAGLGKMGIHRNIIHPRFGNFILLGTVAIDALVVETAKPLDFNPCFECKLCVAACPVGAIGPDGNFDFSACYTHNYREFMGGFTDWVEGVSESKSAVDYRSKTTDSESASMWQSLSFGANYKAAYCMAVCPAGDEILPLYESDKSGFLKRVVTPLREKEEPVYVMPETDAEAYVIKRFPHKEVRYAGNSLRPRTIAQLKAGMPLVFQRGKSKSLEATLHFVFEGRESGELTVIVKQGTLTATYGLQGTSDVTVRADSDTWLGYLAGERNLIWALLRRRVRVKGSLKTLQAFERCFAKR